MLDARQVAYLRALGVDVYVSRAGDHLAEPSRPVAAPAPDAPDLAIALPVTAAMPDTVERSLADTGWDGLRTAVGDQTQSGARHLAAIEDFPATHCFRMAILEF